VPVQADVAPVLGAAAISPTAANARPRRSRPSNEPRPFPLLRTARQDVSPTPSFRAVSAGPGVERQRAAPSAWPVSLGDSDAGRSHADQTATSVTALPTHH
jgi:hypothetical protein